MTLFLCLIVACPVFGQNKKNKNEISVLYGVATAPEIVYMAGGVFLTVFTLGHVFNEDTRLYGAAGAEYVHYVNDWLGFGGTVLGDCLTTVPVHVDKHGNKTVSGRSRFVHVSAMPLVKFAWSNRGRVGFYSKVAVGAGYSFFDDRLEEDQWGLALQFTPVGVDFGGESFRGFAETGFGMQGYLSAGVRWLF